ncbi:hypothetical protein HMPREF1544_07050 [Mucor circinelloides 1006PhL]|uniref:Uncharacterized protein n=1 Tax=Mucor circinelloides f. circinelloides (strain 1006PhL) TaxID=1220926 RepID=S2JTP9_MUCC1|nr:hypothetical protein HMPREF1544_07050 [Mucor circinelloides 1006PhL]
MYPNQTSLLTGTPSLSVVIASLDRTLAVERMGRAALKYKTPSTTTIKLFSESHKAGSTPTSIREALIQQNPDQMSTQKSICNAIARAKLAKLNGLTPIQLLIELLDEKT